MNTPPSCYELNESSIHPAGDASSISAQRIMEGSHQLSFMSPPQNTVLPNTEVNDIHLPTPARSSPQ